MANVTGVVQWACHEYGVFFSQKLVLLLLHLLTSSTLLTFGNIQTSFDIALSQIAMLLLLHLWKYENSTLFHAKKNCLSWHEIQNPRKTPLFCPRIASNVSDVHLYHRGKNLRSTAP